MLIPLPWIGLFATVAVFCVMFALGLMLGREQIAEVVRCRAELARVIFAVIVVVPAIAVFGLWASGVTGAVAVGIILMVISPGAPVALRRALDVGGSREFATALHLAIVALAVVTVPASIVALDWIFSADFSVSPRDVGRQVLFAQLLPMALGALLRAQRPELATRVEGPLVRVGNLLLLALMLLVFADAPSIIRSVGWTPALAGVAVTLCALLLGWTFAWRRADVRPVAAVAAAMRNPGLALVIATVNRTPPEVTATVIGYAIGLGVTLLAFMRWRSRV